MSVATTEEQDILKKADEIRDKNKRQKEKDERAALEKLLQGLCGKFFKTLHFDDEQKEFYRIFHDSWRDNQITVERWYWHSEKHYRIVIDTWYDDIRELYDEEISELEFMQAVTWWMKKVGVYQILMEETNH